MFVYIPFYLGRKACLDTLELHTGVKYTEDVSP